MATFSLLLLALMATGLDQVTAFSAVAACMNNLGPGLGGVGSHYADISDTAKWLLSLAMLLGRLEIFTLLVLLSPAVLARLTGGSGMSIRCSGTGSPQTASQSRARHDGPASASRSTSSCDECPEESMGVDRARLLRAVRGRFRGTRRRMSGPPTRPRRRRPREGTAVDHAPSTHRNGGPMSRMTKTDTLIANLEALISKGHDGTAVRFGLGKAYLERSDAGASRAHLERAVRAGPRLFRRLEAAREGPGGEWRQRGLRRCLPARHRRRCREGRSAGRKGDGGVPAASGAHLPLPVTRGGRPSQSRSEGARTLRTVPRTGRARGSRTRKSELSSRVPTSRETQSRLCSRA